MSRRSHRGWIRLLWLFAFAFTLPTCSLDRQPGDSASNGSEGSGASGRGGTSVSAGKGGTAASSGSAAGGKGGTSSAGKGGSSAGMVRPAVCKGILEPATAATADGAAVEIAIAFADTGCKVAPDFAGTNYEAFPGWGADVSMNAFQQQAFANAGMQLLRYPGGEPGNWTDLLMTGKCDDGTGANWDAPSVGALWDFAESAGVRALMLQTNPTPQSCAIGEHDGSGARAAELAKDMKARGARVVYEVGNEPDIGDSWFEKNAGRDAYIAKFIEHAKAIHAAVPGSEVYGPVICGLGANCSFPTSWDSGWLDAFLARTGDKASGDGKGTVDGVSFHVYWHNEWGFDDLKSVGIGKHGFALYWANTVMPYLRALIAKHDSRDLPIVVSEISVGNGVPNAPQMQNMFSVLATLDTIAAFAASGLRSFQWFDANAEGPADFWMITKDAARPTYYAFAAWAQMGDHVLALRSDTNPVDVAAYATKRRDGSVQVLLINKTDSAHEVALTFDGFDPKGKTAALYTGAPAGGSPSDAATTVLYNGEPNPSPTALPAPTKLAITDSKPKHELPPFSFAVLVFPAS